ncbi:hypothetical protein DQ04_17401010 [Trypanosoma grayi]|uniref:hypothetical protein n=1 Tax=Trypanosoma grayi TaxID=71804 RepID=UPI0004F46107|nr:hypothetical protein DQ04_17401010 [Trypanosoma grayi]KEG05909.1 hypothetical protein DQ04_17401010 [Trypanosoma grayi]
MAVASVSVCASDTRQRCMASCDDMTAIVSTLAERSIACERSPRRGILRCSSTSASICVMRSSRVLVPCMSTFSMASLCSSCSYAASRSDSRCFCCVWW